MILLDVNVLLAAHRVEHPDFPSVRPWFDALLDKAEAFTVPDTVWVSFIRIATNRRVFSAPTPIDEAFAFLRALRSQPSHVRLVPGERHLGLFEELCRDADVMGDLAADAYLTALAVEHGCELVSLDRDFARFERLRWRLPSARALD